MVQCSWYQCNRHRYLERYVPEKELIIRFALSLVRDATEVLWRWLICWSECYHHRLESNVPSDHILTIKDPSRGKENPPQVTFLRGEAKRKTLTIQVSQKCNPQRVLFFKNTFLLLWKALRSNPLLRFLRKESKVRSPGKALLLQHTCVSDCCSINFSLCPPPGVRSVFLLLTGAASAEDWVFSSSRATHWRTVPRALARWSHCSGHGFEQQIRLQWC